MVDATILLVLRIMTALSSFMVSLSPSFSIYKIHKNKTVGNISVVPFVSLLGNAHMWMMYGYFSENIFPVVVSFGFGDFAALVYIAVYYKFAEDRKYVLQVAGGATLVLAAITLYAIIAATGATGQDYTSISHVLGYMSIIAAIILYGAPFEKALFVLRNKNAAPIQLPMVICGATNNALWVIYTPLDSNWFMFIPNTICVVLGIVLLVFPVPDIYNVHRNKSIGEVAELPLITMVVNCHLWMTYGYATDSMFPLFGSQLFGEIVGILYNIVYFRWSHEEKRKQLRKFYAIAFAVWCAVTLYVVLGISGVFGQTKSEVGTSLGYVGCAFSLSMFSSPLATLKHVVSTKSSASIPINMCVMILVSTALWTGAGVVDSDYFVAVINLVGVLLSCTQIVIYFMYRPNKNEDVVIQLEAGNNASFIALSPKVGTHSTVLIESPAYYKSMPSPIVSQRV
ncbi:MtN3-like protein [Phytophthora palmivora]|uniref:Sugar transporter SWEET1 n=1 Tax=Phytophthora palmivora TaxID=4796 RepID=A0A2P4WYC0_9STRA|nr:MtN3-like protein [Phytophthora palmivora]